VRLLCSGFRLTSGRNENGGDAAHLVLDREQMSSTFEVDDVAEAILILVVLAIDELAKLGDAGPEKSTT